MHRAAPYRIHVEARGSALDRPLLLVHGMVVASRGCLPLAEAIARRGWRVVVPDQPGFGRSSKPDRALDVDGLADALGDWITEAGIGPCPVVGNSFGTQVAAALAQRRPQTTTALVLVSPTIDSRYRRWGWPKLLPTGRAPSGLRRGPLAGVQRALVQRLLTTQEDRPSLRSLLWSEYASAGPARALSTYRHALRDDLAARLPHLDVPLLVVRSGADGVVSPEWACRLAREGRGTYEELAGADHDAQYHAPEALGALLDDFLGRL